MGVQMPTNALKKAGKMAEAKEEKTAYIDAKCLANHSVWLAKSEAEKEEFATVFPDGDVFPITKQTAQAKMLLVRIVHPMMLVNLRSLMKII